MGHGFPMTTVRCKFPKCYFYLPSDPEKLKESVLPVILEAGAVCEHCRAPLNKDTIYYDHFLSTLILRELGKIANGAAEQSMLIFKGNRVKALAGDLWKRQADVINDARNVKLSELETVIEEAGRKARITVNGPKVVGDVENIFANNPLPKPPVDSNEAHLFWGHGYDAKFGLFTIATNSNPAELPTTRFIRVECTMDPYRAQFHFSASQRELIAMDSKYRIFYANLGRDLDGVLRMRHYSDAYLENEAYPIPLSHVYFAVCGEQMIMVGGSGRMGTRKEVWSCPLADLRSRA